MLNAIVTEDTNEDKDGTFYSRPNLSKIHTCKFESVLENSICQILFCWIYRHFIFSTYYYNQYDNDAMQKNKYEWIIIIIQS